jgi:serine/threonine-protein kinase
MDQENPPDVNGIAESTCAPTEDFERESTLFTPGNIIGRRYQIQAPLGRGGMGEVWRAFDLKLRGEVALKALHPSLFDDARSLELLRAEVRAARDVISPNVCRIFDLDEADGREFLSMEYVDGDTLLDVLCERGPLELREASEIASQMLAGLQAIHDAGLIHRDIKPENIMLTRTGRVVVMDLGLARSTTELATGSISGTPAYMPPEQMRGEAADGRLDVFAVGVVLAEMASPDGVSNLESRKSLWEGIRQQPAAVPDTPWGPVLRKAVARDPDEGYRSPQALARALDEITLRIDGSEDLHPYPGMASFTQADAEFFFGREAEVEAVWRKLASHHLLAVVGPSEKRKRCQVHASSLFPT